MNAVRHRRSADLTVEQMMKVIDVYGRLAFGGQCVAAMGMLAGPALIVTATIVPFFVWDDNRGEAIGIALGGWMLGIALAVGSIAFALFCWRWSGDWITEWPGYATGFAVAAIACGVLAYLMTSSPVPIWLSVMVTAAGAFTTGVLVAGHLAGTQVLAETRHQRPATARRR